MKVLIIEDEPFAQNELKRLLKDIDSDIEIADCIDTVEDSIIWFNKKEPVDLIFLDIQLSDGISFDIFKEVSRHPMLSDIPTVIISAADSNVEIPKAKSLGLSAYIAKPIDATIFAQQLSDIIAGESIWYTTQ